MSDVNERIANLSPDQRALLEERLLKNLQRPAPLESIPTRQGPGPWTLSFTQQRLWFLDRLEPGSIAYNESSALRLRGPLDFPALERALQEIVRRHESMRTVFGLSRGEPVQIVMPPPDIPLELVDVSALPPAMREGEARSLATQIAQQPFDLERLPLFRSRLVRLDREDHVLAMVTHHIITDGWSAGIFHRELSELYDAFAAGRPSPLPPLSLQYPDYALWQRASLRAHALESLARYWQDALAGVEPLELPADRPRPHVRANRGSRVPFTLARPVADALGAIAREEGATRFMAFMAAWKALLCRYTGRRDIVVGTPVAGRPRPELEPLIGFFANTLALRTDLSDDPSFRRLVARERDAAHAAFAHQEMPFGTLVERLAPDRNLAHSPICQVVFAMQNAPRGATTFSRLARETFDFERGASKFDMTLLMERAVRGFAGVIEYNSDLFDAATARRMAGHFVNLLESAAANPDRAISAIPILSHEERARVVVQWNDTATDYPRDSTVHEVFARAAARHADKPAVVYSGETLTYAALDRRSSDLAAFLRARGVAPEVLVGLCVERSASMVVAMLAILKAGGAYVPLDPLYPPDRIDFMLRDAAVPLILTQSDVASRLPAASAEIVCLDSNWETILSQGRSRAGASPSAAAAAGPATTAYVIYTSGSTGLPKGSRIPHRAINRLVINTNYVDLRSCDRVAQASNASFDAATFEVWGALLNGATLVGMPRDVLLSPKDFAREVAAAGITAMFLTTSLFNRLAVDAPGAFSGLRYLLVGGEAADPACMRAVLENAPPQRLLNAYGPTESTTFAVCHRVRRVPRGARSVPIGRAISNTTLYILDDRGEPVPIGVPGQLHIGGDGLALGYLRRDELTAEKFIPDPFSARPGDRLYRTGDLARWLDDGTIDFLGRLDDQVKIRGFRIEPGEIEAALALHPAVASAAVVCRQDPPGEKRLVAYVVCRPHGARPAAAPGPAAPSVRDLRGFLETRLPDYMVPSAIVLMDALPVTPNGKVDRDALPAPDARDAASARVLPRTPVEEALARIWAEVLAVDNVGVRDSFFDLGGHSLMAVRLFSRIEEVFGRKLPLALLFESPTIEKLAGALGHEGRSGVFPPMIAIQKNGAAPPFFCVATADAFIYADLARCIGPARPFYGLHPQGLIPVENPDIDIRSLASAYVERIRAVRPSGPYHLGGMCAGGVVAYEMAQQLVAAGEEVGVVAFIDSPGPFSLPYKAALAARCAARVADHALNHAAALWRLESGSKVDYATAVLDRVRRRIFREPVAFEVTPEARDVPVERRYWMAFNGAYMRSMARYVPRPYPGRIVMFVASEAAAWRFSSSRMHWRKLARGGAAVHVVPGIHADILYEPQARIIAELLSEHFAEADDGRFDLATGERARMARRGAAVGAD